MMQLVIITGLSGSGKSIALKVLEDSGYYCVDNLPAQLLRETVQFLRDRGSQRVAISIDVRSGSGNCDRAGPADKRAETPRPPRAKQASLPDSARLGLSRGSSPTRLDV